MSTMLNGSSFPRCTTFGNKKELTAVARRFITRVKGSSFAVKGSDFACRAFTNEDVTSIQSEDATSDKSSSLEGR